MGTKKNRVPWNKRVEPKRKEWRPHPKQEKALLSDAYEVLYGGARGGGKTDTGIVKPLYYIHEPLFRGLIIRKNYIDLKDWRDRAMVMYQSSGAWVSEGDINFPSGAKIVLGHFKDEKAYEKYQGHEYQYIGIEELTQIPSEEQYLKLISSCRSTIPGIPATVFTTANPGGFGHLWVKKRFIEPSRPGTVFSDQVSGRSRIYIPATVEDNPTIMENDPGYVKFLESLPPDLRAQWRYGSWENQKIKGSVYQDDIEQAQRENRICRLEVLQEFPVYVAWDLGISKGNEQVAWFYQFKGNEIRFIDCEVSENRKFADHVVMLQNKKYRYAKQVLPHDGVRRAGDTLRSFEDALKESGYDVEVLTRTSDKTRDILISRTIFPRCFFDQEKCEDGLEGLLNYRYEWDEDKQVYKTTPRHDWASNFADAFQQAAVSIPVQQKPQSNVAEAAANYYKPKREAYWDPRPNTLYNDRSTL